MNTDDVFAMKCDDDFNCIKDVHLINILMDSLIDLETRLESGSLLLDRIKESQVHQSEHLLTHNHFMANFIFHEYLFNGLLNTDAQIGDLCETV